MAIVADMRISSIWGHFEEGDPIATSGPKAVPKKAIAAWTKDGLCSERKITVPPQPEEFDDEDEDLEPLDESEDGSSLTGKSKKK